MSYVLTPEILVKESLLSYNKFRTEGNFLKNEKQTNIIQTHIDFIFEDYDLGTCLNYFSDRFIAPATEKLSKMIPKDVKYYQLPCSEDILCAHETWNSISMRFCIGKPDRISQGYLYNVYIDPVIARIDIIVGPETST